MNREEHETLTRAMSNLATAEKAIVPPAALESALLAEFDCAKRSRRRRWIPVAAAGAIAATLACFALLRSPAPVPRAQTRPAPAPVKIAPAIETTPLQPAHKSTRKKLWRTSAAESPMDSNPFVAIPYTLPLDPHEPVTVMRVTMPVSALVAVGLASAAADPTATAPADVIVGEDGRIRALRLVSEFGFRERVNP